VGIGENRLSALENGRFKPRKIELLALASYYGVHIDELSRPAVEQQVSSTDNQNQLLLINKLVIELTAVNDRLSYLEDELGCGPNKGHHKTLKKTRKRRNSKGELLKLPQAETVLDELGGDASLIGLVNAMVDLGWPKSSAYRYIDHSVLKGLITKEMSDIGYRLEVIQAGMA